MKFAVFEDGDAPARVLSGTIEGIGAQATLRFRERGKERARPMAVGDHHAAMDLVADLIERRMGPDAIDAVGHRLVRGATAWAEPCILTPDVLAEIGDVAQLAPVHLRRELGIVRAAMRRCPDVTHVACFDTSFHRAMPRIARRLPIPRRFHDAGVHRLGFHGLSCEHLMKEIDRVAGREAAEGRVVLAHLGSGSSMTAVRRRVPQDTTMGFTPLGGLMMGRRPGDLDPGVLLHLMRLEGMTAQQLDDLVQNRCGLLGVSATNSDMRALLARREDDPWAAEAVALYCRTARKAVGALAAVLGGIDLLVFSGGVGENAPEIREEICDGLDFLGIEIDEERNAAGAGVVSPPGARAEVRVIRTDEETVIARHVRRVLSEEHVA